MSEKKKILKNWLSVYTYKNESLNGFYISLFVRAGSMFEREGESGITHFLEHILIRNVNAGMDGGLYKLLDRYALEFNASTYAEMVQFYISGASKNFRIAADIIARLFSEIKLTRSQVDLERDRIKAEIREVDDKSSLAAFTQNIVFEGTTLSRQITGTAGSVSRITAKRLEEYRRRVFVPENLFFYLTGSFTEDDLRYFENLVASCELYSGEGNKNIAPVPKSFFKRGGDVYIKNATFTKLKFTFDLDMTRLSVPVADILYDTLFAGYSSDFFIEMSEDRGLFYDLQCSFERYSNIGTLSFSYELKEAKIYEALSYTVDILKRFCDTPLPVDRVMKASYVENSDMLYDDIRELNFTFAYDNHILGLGYESLDSRREAYARVTPDMLTRAAKDIFKLSNLTLTVKGNKKKIDAEKIRSIIKAL